MKKANFFAIVLLFLASTLCQAQTTVTVDPTNQFVMAGSNALFYATIRDHPRLRHFKLLDCPGYQ